jgi:hypothetical protein
MSVPIIMDAALVVVAVVVVPLRTFHRLINRKGGIRDVSGNPPLLFLAADNNDDDDDDDGAVVFVVFLL